MTELILKILCVSLIILSWLLMFILPFFYGLKTGKIARIVAISWLLQIFCAILLSIPIPAMLSMLLPDQSDFIYSQLPEANSIVGAFFMGGFFALILGGIAQFIRTMNHSKEPSL